MISEVANHAAAVGSGFLRAFKLRSQLAPACRGQASRLLESTCEMALMGKATFLSDLSQFNFSLEQQFLRPLNLARQQIVLRRLPDQIGESTMKMEGAKVCFRGDFIERRASTEIIVHELHSRNHPRKFRVCLHVGYANGFPFVAFGL